MKKRILSMVLAVILLATLIPLQSFAAESEVTRIQWLQKLTETFDMTVEEDNYPDNYYSDISSSDSYYRDVMVATEFGLIDQEPGTALNPNEPATREFAAHTLNFCLGYELDEGTTYSFSDAESMSYADDAQIAVNRKWFALADGKFMPEQAVTSGEMTAMLADAAAVLAERNVDTGAESTYTFADGVKEIPESADVAVSEDGSSLTVTGYDETLGAKDIIAVHGVFPTIYSVTAAAEADGVQTLTVTKLDADDYIMSMDTQGSVDADLTDVEAADGTTVTYLFSNGVETKSAVRAKALLKANSVKIKDVKLDRTIYGSSGVKVSVYGSLSKMSLDYKVTLGKWCANPYAMVKLNGVATVGCSASFDAVESAGLPSSVPLAYISVAGVGQISVTAKISVGGEVSLSYKANFAAGFEYSSAGGFSMIKNFSAGSFSLQAQVNIKCGIEAKAGLADIPYLKGYVYAEAGSRMNMYYSSVDSDTVKYCIDTSAFVYAAAGYKAELKSIKTWSDTYDIWNMYNSPVKVHNHFENGVSTNGVCTVGSECYNMGYGKNGYTTGADSRYYNFGGSNGSSKGLNAAGEPYTIFEYTTDDDGNATITKYYGNVSALFVPKTIDGYTVTAIGNNAFNGRTELVSVVIPSSIVTIGSCAFYSCSNLSSLIIQDGLTTIKERAFAKCISLTTLDLPDTVTLIEGGAFGKCSNLSNVKLSKSLEQMNAHAFFDCDRLTSIEIPKSLTNSNNAYIGEFVYGWQDGAFYGCDGLKNVSFEEGATTISRGLFAHCPGLESIVIPDTVTKIGDNAFRDCANLKNIKLSESLTEIGSMAFSYCSSLETIKIPDSVTVIYSGAFGQCTSLSNVELSKKLERMDAHAFFNCDALTSIEIPKSLTNSNNAYIGEFVYGWQDGAFYGCDGLKNVSFEEGATTISRGLFAHCPGLESIVIPDTVTKIGDNAFRDCANLKTVELNNGLELIDTSAFNSCTSLTAISIPDTVSSMGTYVFANCTSLTTAKLPNIRVRIMAYTFENCTSLEKIVLPDTVTEIQDHAFKNCTSLKDITWSKSLNTIKDYAFENCDALNEVKLPDSVTNISAGAFYDCDGLTSVSIPNSVTSIGAKLFYDCDALTDVKLGNGITTLTDSMFKHCDVLESVIVPYRVTTIANNAFNECVKLTEITIPSNTTSISTSAFSYPARLTIYGVSGTTAETYAGDIGATFVAIDKPATGVTLNRTELTLNKGQSAKLLVTIEPNDFTDATKWKTSDSAVATIADDGTVKAVGVGTATVSFIAGNTKASCTVTVLQPVTRLSFTKSSISLDGGDTVQLDVNISPEDAANKDIVFSSSDESVATVDQAGLVTALKKGTATITVAAQDGSGCKATCRITVLTNATVCKTVEELQSKHNYDPNSSELWVYTQLGAKKLSITFSEETSVEEGSDYIYIYDNNGNELGKYTGTELAGKTIEVTGDTVKIKLTSDEVMCEYGFAVTKIEADKADTPTGDLTGDDKVDVTDLIRLKKYIADSSTELSASADLNGDGRVDILDLIRLKKIIAGETSFT